MRVTWRYPARAAVLTALAVLAVSCTDRANPTGPTQGPNPGDPKAPPPADPLVTKAILCQADVKSLSVTCGEEEKGPDGISKLIVGEHSNGVGVHLEDDNVAYNAGTQTFSVDITLRNLIPAPQTMGTTDPVTLAPDPSGVRVFFGIDPTVTAGGGSVDIANEDGVDFFTAANQEYFQYNTVLEAYEVSAPRNWQFTVPPTVTNFIFRVFVSAPVPFPNGYLEVEGPTSARSGDTVTFWATPRNNMMVADLAPAVTYTWSSSSPTNAAILNPAAGLTNTQRAGVITVSVTASDGRTGSMQSTIRPRRRIWTGQADNQWNNPLNWLPANVEPQPTDTAVVPAAPIGGAVFPQLANNVTIGGVEVEAAPAFIDIGAFDLTATGDVTTGTITPGQITGTVGRVILAGTARTVVGIFPRVRVTGTYSLDGNVTLNHNLRVEAGRLRTTGFRIRVNNP